MSFFIACTVFKAVPLHKQLPALATHPCLQSKLPSSFKQTQNTSFHTNFPKTTLRNRFHLNSTNKLPSFPSQSFTPRLLSRKFRISSINTALSTNENSKSSINGIPTLTLLKESEYINQGFMAKLITKFNPRIQNHMYLLRLDRPIGTMLLLWPSYWSILLAAYNNALPVSQSALILSYFTIGSFIMRGSGCIINDMWDVDFDKKVARTSGRPLAASKVSMRDAQYLLASQLAIAFLVLTQMNTPTIIYGLLSMPLVVIYPFMKRVTFWPQAVLGLTFNWGAILGWIAMTGSPDWSVILPLYGSGIFWTLIYDTIYAHQDKLDDKRVGVKSTALLFGDKTIRFLSLFSVLSISLLLVSGYNNGNSPIFYAGVLFGCVPHLIWQLKSVNLDSQVSCGQFFRSNTWYGAIVFASIAADYIYSTVL
ncbi:hypothetical protein BB560_003930 [Smittium megazygosporum]|uniref:4-hydroxybenzoate polyprenyltransferase, mitochondrial n=1 Tax=Smittium megazygosporum TaxID=133381 RepID=A0A2T9ZAP1_9FUNG|nr:hypothetical protein BB560_003930 [Smittium megazygosporum]